MTVPTIAEEYAKLNEHLRKAQEASAMIAHLYNSEGRASGTVLGKGFLNISELLKRMIYNVNQLMMGRLN